MVIEKYTKEYEVLAEKFTCGNFVIDNFLQSGDALDENQGITYVMLSDKKPILPVSSSSQMITFTFENGCVATFRGSGTEPKLKYYIELPGKPGVEYELVKKELMELSQALIEDFLHPKENELIPPKQN